MFYSLNLGFPVYTGLNGTVTHCALDLIIYFTTSCPNIQIGNLFLIDGLPNLC